MNGYRLPNITILKQRALLIQAIRHFFVENSFLEVETPIRLPGLLPDAQIEPQTSGNWFLQTSPELCMKRLLAAGIPKIFQICKCFRCHERGKKHLPELTMLEWYSQDCDYRDLMADCENLFGFLADRFGWNLQGCSLDRPWEYLTVTQAFDRFCALSVHEALAQDSFDEVLVRDIEPHLGRNRPVFLYDYPAELASLARLKKDDSSVAERFELYMHGLELANGFSELTDPAEQRLRFEKERYLCRTLGRTVSAMPEMFLKELGEIHRAAGIALGIDRLAMIFFGKESIDEVVAFTPEDL